MPHKRFELKFHHADRRLYPGNLESRFLGLNASTKIAHGWTNEANAELFVDLSRIEFADLGTLAQLVLLIESALSKGIDVSIALPLCAMRRSEAAFAATNPAAAVEIQAAVDNRRRVMSFLDHAGFLHALAHAHLKDLPGKPQFLETFDSSHATEHEGPTYSRAVSPEELNDEIERATRTYARIVPLTWISHQDRTGLQNLERFLAKILDHSGTAGRRGILPLDSQTLAHVVAEELSQNVLDHSGRSWGLVTAWSAGSDFWNPLSRSEPILNEYLQRFLSPDAEYVKWFQQFRSPFIEFYFGDSGKGVFDSLQKEYVACNQPLRSLETFSPEEQVLLWSFDRWSSSKAVGGDQAGRYRGTRGLYRIDRVVRKYDGFVGIRSGNSYVGLDHGGSNYDQPVRAARKLGYFPGTLVKVRMASHSTSSSLPARAEVRGNTCKYAHGPVKLTRNGLAPESAESLIAAFKGRATASPFCYVAFVSLAEDASDVSVAEVVRRALRDFAELRHPGLLVVYGLPGGWDLVSGEIESFNGDLDHAQSSSADATPRPDAYTVYDPILVVDAKPDQWAWAAAPQGVRDILTRLLLSATGTLTWDQLRSLSAASGDSLAAIRALRSDTDLVSFDHDRGITTNFTFTGLADYTAALLKQNVERQVLREDGRSVYVTPSLGRTLVWLDGNETFRMQAGPSLLALSLSIKLLRLGVTDKPIHLLAESSYVEHIVAEMSKCLGGATWSVMPGEAEAVTSYAVPPLPQDCDIVIVSWITRTLESSDRCIREVVRSGARAFCVARLLAIEDVPHHSMDPYGVDVPIVTLYSHAVTPSLNDAEQNVVYLNPITLAPEQEPAGDAEPNTASLLDLTGAVCGHLETRVGRHFTLYLSPSSILDSQAMRTEASTQLREWLTKEGFSGDWLDVWVPEDLPVNEKSVTAFLNDMESSGLPKLRKKVVPRKAAYGSWRFSPSLASSLISPYVVIFDWSAVTSATLKGLAHLAVANGATHVLVLIPASLLPRYEHDFLSSVQAISGVGVRMPSESFGRSAQTTLAFSEDVAERPVQQNRNIRLEFVFLSSYPGTPYSEEHCPVCEQRRRIDAITYPTALKEIAARLSERLSPIKAVDLYDKMRMIERPTFSMSSLLTFRVLLEDALTSTRRREEIRRLLDSLMQRPAGERSEFLKSSLAIVHLLSREIQWLKSPPLHFRPLRETLAKLCRLILSEPSVSVDDKINAIVVLRSASKYHFAIHSHEIYGFVHNHERCAECVVHSMFTMTAAHGADDPLSVVLKPLRQAANDILTDIRESRLAATADIQRSLRIIVARLMLQQGRADNARQPLPEVWRRLQEAYDVYYDGRENHCTLQHNMRQILPGGDRGPIEQYIANRDTGQERDLPEQLVEYCRRVEAHWPPIRDFIVSSVEPALFRLRDIVEMLSVCGTIQPDACQTLLAFADDHVPFSESPFALACEDLANQNKRVFTAAAWKHFLDVALRLKQHLFVRVSQRGEPGAAALVELLFSVPGNLALEVRNWFISEKAAELFSDDRVQITFEIHDATNGKAIVFYPQQYLSELCEELVQNIVKHRGETKRVRVRVDVNAVGETCELLVVNDYVRAKNADAAADRLAQGVVGGKGLQKHKDVLGVFGGNLEYPRLPGEPGQLSSFSVRATFLKGER